MNKEHLFLRNLYDKEVLNDFKQIKNITTYYENFKRMLNCIVLLDKMYSLDGDMEDIDHTCIGSFLRIDLNEQYSSFEEAINQQKIKTTTNNRDKKSVRLEKRTALVYLNIMQIPNNDQIEVLPVSSNFFKNTINILYDNHVIHHSHITGEITGYAHAFCSRKLRENKNNISVIEHNLFSFDFFFFLKGIRLSVWKTYNFSISGSNLTQINYANIGEQIKFIDTMKYYQQSLAKLAESMTEEEKEKIKNELKNFIEKHDYFAKIFSTSSDICCSLAHSIPVNLFKR